MVTVTELNRAPNITVNAIDAASVSAGDTITDPSGTDHTDELADITDVSQIQSSGDVTVTDTQVGTVEDGEFLQNSGGSLTGGTVQTQTEPNVPDWIYDGTLDANNTTEATYNISGSYDKVMLFFKGVGDEPGFNKMRLNGNTSTDYEYREADGTQVSDANLFNLGQPTTYIHQIYLTNANYEEIGINVVHSRPDTNIMERGWMYNGSSIDSFTITEYTSSEVVDVFGYNF